ncbi:hypothetical protein Pelo_6033 [Pelomyxa schiedti]|nr:hypothetical protein Pelo_6033 [Pelomyxa schiedti]
MAGSTYQSVSVWAPCYNYSRVLHITVQIACDYADGGHAAPQCTHNNLRRLYNRLPLGIERCDISLRSLITPRSSSTDGHLNNGHDAYLLATSPCAISRQTWQTKATPTHGTPVGDTVGCEVYSSLFSDDKATVKKEEQSKNRNSYSQRVLILRDLLSLQSSTLVWPWKARTLESRDQCARTSVFKQLLLGFFLPVSLQKKNLALKSIRNNCVFDWREESGRVGELDPVLQLGVTTVPLLHTEFILFCHLVRSGA